MTRISFKKCIILYKMFTNYLKHFLHCCALLSFIFVFGNFAKNSDETKINFNPWLKYGYSWTIALYLLKLLTFIQLPQVLFNFVGLIIYNVFPKEVSLKQCPTFAPFICYRIVTRGNFPDLVKSNVERNMKTCTNVGQENFIIEVVTDKSIGLKNSAKVREVVVPSSYKTKSGALYKARALQYCLEDDVNILNDNDWIVHLDEETLLTEDCVKGILNFVSDGIYDFGQGVITYANENIVNWITTLADTARVADDMGKLRLTLKLFHKPLFSWKGSYVVSRAKAEKAVSYDNGPDGSIAEDSFFALKAYNLGYTFDFIEGVMWEKSPFSILDFTKQRKRWYQGVLLVVHSKELPWTKRIFLACQVYNYILLPLLTSNIVFSHVYQIPYPAFIDYTTAFITAVSVYMFIFGIIKSLDVKEIGALRFVSCLCSIVFIIPLNILLENVASLWSIIGKKDQFDIVDKKIKLIIN